MPEFHLDTSGAVYPCPSFEGRKGGLLNPEQRVMIGGAVEWSNLDDFTQGYVEALFFTGVEGPKGDYRDGDFVKANATGFSDLAPEALASIIEDCRAFRSVAAWRDMCDAFAELGGRRPNNAQAGRDFWYTRNGHGVGFWDGDWPEPYATALAEAAKAFGGRDVYLGDDGKVHIS